MKNASLIGLLAVVGLGLLAAGAAAIGLPPLEEELPKFLYDSNKGQLKKTCLELRSLTESELTKVPADVASDHVFQAMLTYPTGVYQHVGKVSERADWAIVAESPMRGMIKTRSDVGKMFEEYEKFLSEFMELYHYDNFHIPENELRNAEIDIRSVVRSPLMKRLVFATLKSRLSAFATNRTKMDLSRALYRPKDKIEQTCKFVESTIQILESEYKRIVGQEKADTSSPDSDELVGGVKSPPIKNLNQLECVTTQLLFQIESFCKLYRHEDGLIDRMLTVTLYP